MSIPPARDKRIIMGVSIARASCWYAYNTSRVVFCFFFFRSFVLFKRVRGPPTRGTAAACSSSSRGVDKRIKAFPGS